MLVNPTFSGTELATDDLGSDDKNVEDNKSNQRKNSRRFSGKFSGISDLLHRKIEKSSGSKYRDGVGSGFMFYL